MKINMDWIKEEWATDLMAQIAKDIFAPKPKETAPVSPQLGGTIKFGDWVIPVSIIGGIVVLLLMIWLFTRGG